MPSSPDKTAAAAAYTLISLAAARLAALFPYFFFVLFYVGFFFAFFLKIACNFLFFVFFVLEPDRMLVMDKWPKMKFIRLAFGKMVRGFRLEISVIQLHCKYRPKPLILFKTYSQV